MPTGDLTSIENNGYETGDIRPFVLDYLRCRYALPRCCSPGIICPDRQIVKARQHGGMRFPNPSCYRDRPQFVAGRQNRCGPSCTLQNLKYTYA